MYHCELYFILDCGLRGYCQVHVRSKLPVAMIMSLANKNARPPESIMHEGGHYSLDRAIFPGSQRSFMGIFTEGGHYLLVNIVPGDIWAEGGHCTP